MKDLLLITEGVGQVRKFIASLLAPLQEKTNETKTFEGEQLRRARYNGQKIVLQAALNEIFGITAPPYIIVQTNPSIVSNTYFYEPSEETPIYFSEPDEMEPVYLYEPGELLVEDYDFSVSIPLGIWTAELERQIKAETLKYKIAGTRVVFAQY